ncbi:MAG: HAMP domain-containing histidine kinase [Tepidibacter sp.]|jgi:signal transduction histidine kinase|uniref:sensor histidine kinase n=1 Tax=Tepidibacter sp. TaxID=2529387 RepID=UPI0025F435F5|nr:HAMP domain-containing sensor histidine kinase [Tepidibacter sp.]MCT4507375.1 HAMP domain-containing histidine kinase [Tepidibacter sp.]
MKNKIFYKLFGMTVGVVLVILLLQFGFQCFLLESFYLFNKERLVYENVESLIAKLEVEEISDNRIEEIINIFSIENDIPIGISNIYGSIQYGLISESKGSYLLIENENREIYEISLDGFLENNNFSEALNMNEKITVEDFWYEKLESTIYPQYIKIDGKEFYCGFNYNQQLDDSNYEEDLYLENLGDDYYYEDDKVIEAKIIDANIYENEFQGISYRNDLLINEMVLKLQEGEGVKEIFESSEGIIYIKSDVDTGTQNMFFVSPLYLKNKKPLILFATSSLQSINEATIIMNKFSMFILIVAIFIAMVASYIFSKRIAKPLLHLNKITKDMSHLDFTDKCEIHTNDELEELADNINNLSNRLEVALNDLRNSNSKLKEDIELKEKMEEFRKRFIAHSSHELKTPLTILKGISEGLMNGVYNREDDINYRNILKEIDNMSQLTHDLLEISRIESGDLPFKEEIFQLSDVILKVYDKLKPLIKNKNLEVELDLSEDFIRADEEKIESVISNLLNNAIQYTPENGNISIRIERDYSILKFSIENTPAMIPEEDIQKIWEPFYRVEKSRNKALGGTGLGLHLIKEILERHGFEYYIKNTHEGVKIGFFVDQSEIIGLLD